MRYTFCRQAIMYTISACAQYVLLIELYLCCVCVYKKNKKLGGNACELPVQTNHQFIAILENNITVALFRKCRCAHAELCLCYVLVLITELSMLWLISKRNMKQNPSWYWYALVIQRHHIIKWPLTDCAKCTYCYKLLATFKICHVDACKKKQKKKPVGKWMVINVKFDQSSSPSHTSPLVPTGNMLRKLHYLVL